MKPYYCFVILLTLSFIFQKEPIFAQDSFNTQFLFGTSSKGGDFIDVIVEDNYIYAIVGDYVKVYETSDQMFLNFISQTSLYNSTSSPSKVLKNGNKIVVLFSSKTFPDNNPGGIKIYEVDAEHKIKFLSEYDISGFKHGFTLTDKYIFVAAGESGLYIIDYQNPISPFVAGRYNPGGYSIGNGIVNISVSGNIASVSMFSEGLDLIDITNISQPKKLFSLLEKGDGVNGTLLTQDFLYVFLENSSQCKIYNISDLQNIKFLSSITTHQYIKDVSISGDYLFVSEYGTQIINISDKTKPFHVGFTNTRDLNLTHYVNNDKIFTTSFLYDSGNYIFNLAIFSFNDLNSKIDLSEPNYSSPWLSGETKSIVISAYNINSVDIEISPDAGSTWKKVVNNCHISGYKDNISFIVPKFHSSQCLLKVSDMNNSDTFDLTSNQLEIKRLQLTEPILGSSYINSVTLKWETNDLDTVSIYYSLDDGLDWNIFKEKLIDSLNNFQRNYIWQFENLGTRQARFKIADYNDVQTFEISLSVTLKSTVSIADSAFKYQSAFFPLQVGNFWQYKKTHNSTDGTFYHGYDNIEIIGETVINNNKYYKIKWLDNNYGKFFRYDTLHSSVLSYISGEEKIVFELDSQTGDCWQFENTNREICNEGIFEENIFGKIDTVMHLNQYYYCKAFNLSYRIGPVWISNDDSYMTIDYDKYYLVYAKIGGIEYGTFVDVEDEEINNPKLYFLSQNYPNPFNPTTIIKYAIPSNVKGETASVKLVIYDVLGREIKTLINEEHSAGTYDVEFNANELTSGIYFYKLQSGSFIETKKMLLLR
jgi:hypothetical protein